MPSEQPNPEGRRAEDATPSRCMAMHSTGLSPAVLIPRADHNDTSKCPYMSNCQARQSHDGGSNRHRLPQKMVHSARCMTMHAGGSL